MTVHEYGEANQPIILLFPGTACHWKANFEGVLELLAQNFRVGIVAYTGFDENDREDFSSMTEETEKIEQHIAQHYGGHIHAAYGCSLGGSFVAQLAARRNITMKYAIIGSSDFDQSGRVGASFRTSLMMWLLYPYIHTGRYKLALAQKKMERRMSEADPYGRAFIGIVGRDRYDMSFISKKSFANQFYSDLVTRLPEGIELEGGEIHVLYAKRMGEKYLARYKKHFANPIIHEHDLRHEELLGVYPEEWAQLITQIIAE